MFVRFFLKSDRHAYVYDDVNAIDVGRHYFPSGKSHKALTLILDNGNTLNFVLSEVVGLCIENFKDERHPWNDDAKVIFVEDGKSYERS